MATQRTFEEKSEILAHCLELERTGGDILAYLWSENYLTPRATWFNYQREWLHRKPYEYTDGKPKKKKETKNMANRFVVADEQKLQAAQIAINGGNPYSFLKGLGAKEPNGVWFNIKKWLEKNHPDVYEKVPKYINRNAKKLELEAGENYEISAKEAMDGAKEAADTFFGQCEEIGLKVHGTVESFEDYIKNQIDPYDISAIRHKNYGEFYYDHDHNCIDWRTPEGDEVSMSVQGWKGLICELPRIMKILGVEP